MICFECHYRNNLIAQHFDSSLVTVVSHCQFVAVDKNFEKKVVINVITSVTWNYCDILPLYSLYYCIIVILYIS